MFLFNLFLAKIKPFSWFENISSLYTKLGAYLEKWPAIYFILYIFISTVKVLCYLNFSIKAFKIKIYRIYSCEDENRFPVYVFFHNFESCIIKHALVQMFVFTRMRKCSKCLSKMRSCQTRRKILVGVTDV